MSARQSSSSSQSWSSQSGSGGFGLARRAPSHARIARSDRRERSAVGRRCARRAWPGAGLRGVPALREIDDVGVVADSEHQLRAAVALDQPFGGEAAFDVRRLARAAFDRRRRTGMRRRGAGRGESVSALRGRECESGCGGGVDAPFSPRAPTAHPPIAATGRRSPMENFADCAQSRRLSEQSKPPPALRMRPDTGK